MLRCFSGDLRVHDLYEWSNSSPLLLLDTSLLLMVTRVLIVLNSTRPLLL